MNETSACVTTVVFMYWLKNHFVPRKESGNVLDFAAENDIIQLFFRSDTTHYLHPLFRSLFKPLTTFWQQAMNSWIRSNPSLKITRLQFGRLLTVAWNQAATAGNGSAGFSACGIYPYDPQQVPHHVFAISDRAVGDSNSIAAVEGAVIAKKPGTSFNIPATDQASVATSNTNSAATRNTFFEDINPVPLVKRPKPTVRRKQRAQVLSSAELRMAMLRKK